MNPTERTQLQRLPERESHDPEVVHAVLDAAFLAHVGFSVDQQPFVIPTLFGRDGDTLYLHGSAASRMLGTLDKGIPACVTATIVDGLVLARSAFHHSINYRSVVALGRRASVGSGSEGARARLASIGSYAGACVAVAISAFVVRQACAIAGRWLESRGTIVEAKPPGESLAHLATDPVRIERVPRRLFAAHWRRRAE
jgi:nitroimidazol reductase NimA-like FMN-containing flavoprotein (pyridoxamine 5'-phosphate oxidase superfamily)